MNKNILQAGLMLVLVAVVVAGRMIPHWPNFVPVMAVGLFAAYAFRSRLLAIGVPAAGLLASDLFIEGTYGTSMMVVNYAALCIPALLGFWIAKPGSGNHSQPRRLMNKGGKVVLGATAASTIFFIFSNLGVWLFSGMYGLTPDGLAACFAAALPFYKFSLAGDLFYSVAIFGTAWAAALAFGGYETKRAI